MGTAGMNAGLLKTVLFSKETAVQPIDERRVFSKGLFPRSWEVQSQSSLWSIVTTKEARRAPGCVQKLSLQTDTAERSRGIRGSPSEKADLTGLAVRLHPFVCLLSPQEEPGANSDSFILIKPQGDGGG